MTVNNPINRVEEWQWECIKLTYNNNSETDTGWDLPKYGEIDPFSMGIFVQTVDATETIDVGLLYSENSNGGDADGFLVGLSLATAGWVRPGIVYAQAGSNYPTATTQQFGAYFTATSLQPTAGTGVANVWALQVHNYVGGGVQKSLSYTCSSGSDTFVGFLMFRWRQLPDLTNFLV